MDLGFDLFHFFVYRFIFISHFLCFLVDPIRFPQPLIHNFKKVHNLLVDCHIKVEALFDLKIQNFIVATISVAQSHHSGTGQLEGLSDTDEILQAFRHLLPVDI